MTRSSAAATAPTPDFAQLVADGLRFSCEMAHAIDIPPGYTTGWRIMPTAVVTTVTSGWCQLEVEDQLSQTLESGMGVCIPAGTTHRFSHPQPSAAASSHVNFHIFANLDVLTLVSLPRPLPAGPSKAIAAINQQLAVQPDPGRGLLRTICARQALGFALLQVVVDAGTITARAVDALRATQRLAPVLAAVDHDLANVDAPTMARLAGLSRTRLHELFVQAVDASPMEYVRRRRLQRARELLASSVVPIAEVSILSGFSDPFHFSRAFKQVHGMSPSHYRISLADRLL